MDTCSLPNKGLSFSSALILRRLAGSCKSCFLMYSQIFLVTSVRGSGSDPMTAASSALGVSGFMKAAFGLRAGLLAVDIRLSPYKVAIREQHTDFRLPAQSGNEFEICSTSTVRIRCNKVLPIRETCTIIHAKMQYGSGCPSQAETKFASLGSVPVANGAVRCKRDPGS